MHAQFIVFLENESESTAVYLPSHWMSMGYEFHGTTAASVLTDHTRTITVDVSPVIQQLTCDFMRVENKDPLTWSLDIHQRTYVKWSSLARGTIWVGVPYWSFQSSNSFHGVVERLRRLPMNGRPTGPGGNLCVVRRLMTRTT